MDPIVQLTLAVMSVLCFYRMVLAIITYYDASGRGSDAMSWMALVSVLGLIPFIIWLVVRPKTDLPYYPPGYIGPLGPVPGMYYPPPPYDGKPRDAPTDQRYGGMAPPSPPQGPLEYPMPAPGQYQVPVRYPAPQQYQGPAGYPPQEIFRPPVYYPPPQQYQGPNYQPPPPYHPAPGNYPPAARILPAARSSYDPFAVHRMIATFFAAMAFTIFIELPVMFLVIALASPDIADPNAAVMAVLTPEMILFAVAVQDAILVFFLYLAMLKPGHLTLKGMGLAVDHRLPSAVLLGTLIGLAIFGMSTMIGIVLDGTGLFGGQVSPFQATGGPGLAFIAIATVLIAPLAEELFFRGYALSVLEKKWGATAGVLLSAVLFALAHQSIYQFIAILPSGIVLGLGFRKWGIMPCMMAHAVNNLVAVVLLFLAGS